MKKISALLIVLLTFLLVGCSPKVEPIEGISIEEYNLLYEADDFKIYIIKDVSEIQATICIVIEDLKDESCCLGISQTNAYVVQYNDQYISLRNGVDLDLFDTYDLIEYGVSFSCRED